MYLTISGAHATILPLKVESYEKELFKCALHCAVAYGDGGDLFIVHGLYGETPGSFQSGTGNESRYDRDVERTHGAGFYR